MKVNLSSLGHLGFRSFGFAFITGELRTGSVWQAQLCGDQELTPEVISSRLQVVSQSHRKRPTKLEIYSRIGPHEFYERVIPFPISINECAAAILREWSSHIDFVSRREADKQALQFFIAFVDANGAKVEDKPRSIREAFAYSGEDSILEFVRSAQANLGTKVVNIEYKIQGPRDLLIQGSVIADADPAVLPKQVMGCWYQYHQFWSY